MVSIKRDNVVILQCWPSPATLVDTNSLQRPGYTNLQFQLHFWANHAAQRFGTLSWKLLHPSEFQIDIVKVPRGVEALDSAIIVNKSLAASEGECQNSSY